MRWLPLRITDTKFNLTIFYILKYALPVALTVVLQ